LRANKGKNFSCRSRPGNVSLALKHLICCLIGYLQDGQSSNLQTPSQETCAYCQRTWGVGLSAYPVSRRLSSLRAAHYSGLFAFVNTSFRGSCDCCLAGDRSPSPKRAAYYDRLFSLVNNL